MSARRDAIGVLHGRQREAFGEAWRLWEAAGPPGCALIAWAHVRPMDESYDWDRWWLLSAIGALADEGLGSTLDVVTPAERAPLGFQPADVARAVIAAGPEAEARYEAAVLTWLEADWAFRRAERATRLLGWILDRKVRG